MKLSARLLAMCLTFSSISAPAQDRAAISQDFYNWLETEMWPRAQTAGVSRATFDAALSGVELNWDLPGLVIANAPNVGVQRQAEFRPPARYFDPSELSYAARTGRGLLDQHATTLNQIAQDTGVPAGIILAIWGRESSFGQASIPYDAFEILGTKGFMSTRPALFSEELIAALMIVEEGFATRAEMKSSWAGALGQPQFMPTSYLKYAVDGDSDGHADIWTSEKDTLASIAAYLRDHGWIAGRSWGREVTVPQSVPCYLEGPDQGKSVAAWNALGVVPIRSDTSSGSKVDDISYLLMPAGRFGPAFLVSQNFYVLKDYNESDVYALFVGHVADRIASAGPNFQGIWHDLDDLTRGNVIDVQLALEAQDHDVGGADGFIGYKTRRSIGQWQSQTGREVTCYPSHETVASLVK